MNQDKFKPEYEVMSTGERAKRDPRGLARVTLLGNGWVIARKGKLPPLVEAPTIEENQLPETAIENEGGEQ
jgi:hypothetical protein